jgi:hypothetical protein
MMSVTRVLMPHLTLSGRPRAISSSQNWMNFLRLMVGSSSARMKKPTVVVDQVLDLVDHLLRIAHAVVAPELPLAAEGTGEGAAARHVGNGDAHAERHIDVFAPIQERPVRD